MTTTVPNRTHLSQRSDSSTAYALLYINLESVKLVLDAHGQEMGEELLRAVTMRLERSVRSHDAVSYLGGDNFVCRIGGMLSHEQLSHLACKLFDVVSEPFKIGLVSVTVRPSVGIAMNPVDGGTPETLLTSAGAAMLRAKRLQSGYAFCTEAGGITIG